MDVVILAGGLGTRLRSVVSEVPKCMAPVSSRPFLFYLLKYLADYQFSKSFDSRVSGAAGNLNVGLGEQRSESHFKFVSGECSIERVVLSVGYLREKIYEWIDSCREQFPFQIVFAVEEQPLGTGGGIRLALEQCSSEHVAILNGDTFFGVDLDSFSDFHINSGALLSLALKPMEHFSRYGTVNVSENGMITAFNEKCYCERGLINGGLYLAKREALSQYLATKPEKFSFEKEVLEALVNSATTVNSATQVNPACGIDSDSFMSTVAVGGAECCADHKAALGAVFGFESNDYFIDIGIPEDYARAEREFKIASGIIDLGEGGDTLLLDRDGVINCL
ncbi:MAG: nucleotidyltransferase family protein, partial [Odoribacter sp.]|nr:nucleotidyltransferase family protein [Odoribacter sp.]